MILLLMLILLLLLMLILLLLLMRFRKKEGAGGLHLGWRAVTDCAIGREAHQTRADPSAGWRRRRQGHGRRQTDRAPMRGPGDWRT